MLPFSTLLSTQEAVKPIRSSCHVQRPFPCMKLLRAPWSSSTYSFIPCVPTATQSPPRQGEHLLSGAPGGPSRYPDLTGSVRFHEGADVCLNPASREPVWTWQPAELSTTCVLTSICLPWTLSGLKTDIGAGCGLQGQSSFLGDSCNTSMQMVKGRRSWLGVPPLKWSSHLEPP